MAHHYQISHTWDGEPVAPQEVVHVQLQCAPDVVLITLDAPFFDDPPPDAPPGPTWQLWNHEVVELFIAGPDEDYIEIEFGPHGHHLVIELRGIRNAVRTCLPLEFASELDGTRWRGRAQLPRSLLPDGPHRLNLYAIHGAPTARRYLAMKRVPGERPDFHQPHCFEPVDLG